MHIQGFGINGLTPLEYLSHIYCDSRINLFVGPNATGKTTILRAMNAFYSQGSDEEPGPDTVTVGKSGSIYLEPSDDWPRDPSLPFPDNVSLVKWGGVPLLYIPATRVSLVQRDLLENLPIESQELDSDAPLKRLFQTEQGIFSGQYVELAIDWLRRFIGGRSGHREQQLQFRKAVNYGHACSQRICSEIVSEDGPFSFYTFNDDHPSERIAHYGMGISTTDDFLADPLYVGDLSSGTQGTLLWIWALTLKMVNHYRWQDGWENKPAILLIDEIENHLHPTWQRRVIPALLEHFPGLQIFATTHSPFVVAGLKAGQVHLLNRDAEGRVTASTNSEDIIGWTADEILRTWMGVDEPTDLTTINRANRLRELREEPSLTADEESELNTLRQQVNESLLSRDGPIGPQRERYADLMQRFLQTRQSDLNQDGG